MGYIAYGLSRRGFHLRSGGAEGGDAAFASKLPDSSKTQFLPWPKYNGIAGPSARPLSSTEMSRCKTLASTIHPAWHRCTDAVRKLHARNVAIILGPDLETHSIAVIAWTPKGEITGGTGFCLRLATHYRIPVFNLFDHQDGNAIIEALLELR